MPLGERIRRWFGVAAIAVISVAVVIGLLGYWLCAEVVDATTVVRIAIVVGSGLFIARREHRLSSSDPR